MATLNAQPTGSPQMMDLLKRYQRLHDGLSEMVESGRLTEADVPEDYDWLVNSMLVPLANDSAQELLAQSDVSATASINAQPTGSPQMMDLLKSYQRLHDGLSEMVESGRLTEADIPEDYDWLVNSMLVPLANDSAQELLAQSDVSATALRKRLIELGSALIAGAIIPFLLYFQLPFTLRLKLPFWAPFATAVFGFVVMFVIIAFTKAGKEIKMHFHTSS